MTESLTIVDENHSMIINELLDRLYEPGLNYVPGYKEYRASSASACARLIYLAKREIDYPYAFGMIERRVKQQDRDKDRLGASILGTNLHEYIQRRLEQTNGDIELLEVEGSIGNGEGMFIEGIKIRGHYDLLVKINGETIVVDIKTTNNLVFKNERYLTEQLEKWEKQLSLYQYALGKIPGAILIVNRIDFSLKWIPVKYDQNVFDGVIEHFLSIAESEEKNQLPIVPMYPFQWPCASTPKEKADIRTSTWPCKYWDICHNPKFEHLKEHAK